MRLGLLLEAILIRMMNRVASTFSRKLSIATLLRKPAYSAHDWSHIYDGIYKFEDQTLG